MRWRQILVLQYRTGFLSAVWCLEFWYYLWVFGRFVYPWLYVLNRSTCSLSWSNYINNCNNPKTQDRTTLFICKTDTAIRLVFTASNHKLLQSKSFYMCVFILFWTATVCDTLQMDEFWQKLTVLSECWTIL